MMKNGWSAEITNDPDRDYDLYIELLENDEYRGRIFRNKNRELVIEIYGSDRGFQVCAEWLQDVLKGATTDLK